MPAHDIETSIDRYTPANVPDERWTAIAPTVRIWVRRCEPSHYQRAIQLLAAGAALGIWCQDNQIPVTDDHALRTTTIERFCAVAERDERYSSTTRSTIRSRLRCIARAAHVPGNPPATPTLPRNRVRDPYTDTEVAALLRLARAQSTPERRRRLEALLGCGLGAGCGPADFRALRPDHVESRNGGALLHLRGRRPRSVWVLDAYVDVVIDAADRCPGAYLIGGERPDRRSITTGLLHAIDGDPAGPVLEPGRLRSTWLLTHLRAGTRLDLLMDAAGLSTATTLTDLRRHLPPPGECFAEPQLRGHSTTRAAIALHAGSGRSPA